MLRIGLLTSGGDCQALNAAMRGVVKGLSANVPDLEVYGFFNGYHGLIYGDYRLLTSNDFSGILTKGGTILGSSRQPFKLMREPDENGLDKVEAMKSNYYKLNLNCLVILGGNGTQKTANLLREEGLNIIHLPKTIDNDIYGTDMTFGFYSAVNIACEAIDCIHTTAASHNRVFIVEVMGHKVGWLTLYAGVASGADIILLPEIPYDDDKIVEAIEARHKAGKGFTILAVAEGAISKEDAKLSKKELKKKQEKEGYPSVSYRIAKMIGDRTGAEARVTVPGHTQRGGSPCPYDRALCTRLGSAAAKAIMDQKYGNMVAIVDGETKLVPLGE
ncbi:MAG: 6-phosphofructokinase, partial [Lachnospiraceae bacterium]|nr:6-phosphofructokinase [Lachnospiraceae bacterium]